MANFIKTQNSFADGEVSPEFFSRDNINGLSKLENMDVLSSGAISRRPGLSSVAKLSGPARIISFSVADNEDYVIVMTDYKITVYYNNEYYQKLDTPWPYDALSSLQYAQRFGTMIFVHPDYRPYVLQREGTAFRLSVFYFERNTNLTFNMPFMRFDDSADIRITIGTHSLGNNYATFTTNEKFIL